MMGQKQHGAGHTLVKAGRIGCFAAQKGLGKTVALQGFPWFLLYEGDENWQGS